MCICVSVCRSVCFPMYVSINECLEVCVNV